MAFTDLLTRAVDHAFTCHSVASLSYTPKGGSPASIPVLYSLLEDPFEDGRYQGGGMEACVRASDVADPGVGDSIILGSDTFTVRKVLESFEGTVWTLKLTKDERASA